jgi:hypothetical protein
MTTIELKKTEIAEQMVIGTVFIWLPLNKDDDVCEWCGCMITDERELDIMSCRQCAEAGGYWEEE